MNQKSTNIWSQSKLSTGLSISWRAASTRWRWWPAVWFSSCLSSCPAPPMLDDITSWLSSSLAVLSYSWVFIIKIKMCDKSFSQVATLVSITLAIFGLDASSLKADRVISKLQSPSLLTGFLRLSFVYNAAFNSMRKLHCVLPDSARPALASGQACLGLSQCWARLQLILL